MNDKTLNSTQAARDAEAVEAQIAEQERLEEEQPEKAASSRRRALRTLGTLGLGTAAALSFSTFGPGPLKALAETRASFRSGATGRRLAHDILNFALTLEYLEMYFYEEGTDSGVISDSGAMEVFELIEDHERKHVNFLTETINSLGEGPDPVEFSRDDFDFTAGGAFDPFNDYATFLLLAQGFEDTGVRAYKGQAAAPAIMDGPYLTPALRIHSLEARHSAEVRRIRNQRGRDVQPWIILRSVPDDSPIANVYAGSDAFDDVDADFPAEDNVVQPASGPLATDLTTLGYTREQVSAAFDEPMVMGAVLAIADPFIVDDDMAEAVTLDFSNDIGVLNYAYALEQLETAFYAQATANMSGFSSETQRVLGDLAAHEDIHRQTLQTALGDQAIIDLTPDFSSVDFSDEDAVLATAQILEDVGVSAYNGAGRFLENADFLAAAGSIVSVEARHAAAIRDLMNPSDDYFGGEYVIDNEYVIGNGALDEARTPQEVIDAASGFIANEITVMNADA